MKEFYWRYLQFHNGTFEFSFIYWIEFHNATLKNSNVESKITM